MARYIDADYILKVLAGFNDRKNGNPHFFNGIDTAKEIVENLPTADVVEVKHGEWLDCVETGTTVAGIKVSGFVGYKCSLCGRYEGKKEPYCNCGAKMDGGK